MEVALIDHMGDDRAFVRAARVSVGRDILTAAPSTEDAGLINFLVKNRHGSPFEHAVMTWRIEAPIFVWREFMRHRIASYNEMSSRYTVLPAEFYVPAPDRPLVQVGKPGAYTFEPGDGDQYRLMENRLKGSAYEDYLNYETMLNQGIAKEVARMVLPVNIYSVAYVTMNVRALTNFLSLRTKARNATFPSYPQREIEMVAEDMERHFWDHFPITHECWNVNGRVPL